MNRVLRFALLGNPVSHSASPAMHRAAFRAMGLPHSYDPVACPDHASLANALKESKAPNDQIDDPFHPTNLTWMGQLLWDLAHR